MLYSTEGSLNILLSEYNDFFHSVYLTVLIITVMVLILHSECSGVGDY